MPDGHKLTFDAGVGADGRRSTMTSTRSRSRASASPFPLSFQSQLRRRLLLEPFSSKPTSASSLRPKLDEDREHAPPARTTTSR